MIEFYDKLNIDKSGCDWCANSCQNYSIDMIGINSCSFLRNSYNMFTQL